MSDETQREAREIVATEIERIARANGDPMQAIEAVEVREGYHDDRLSVASARAALRQIAEAGAAALEEGLEKAASTRPSRLAGNPPDGRWGGQYQVGWDDAVVAYAARIRALIGTPAGKGDEG